MTTKTTRKVTVDSHVQDLQKAARAVRAFVLAPTAAGVDDAMFGLGLLNRYVRIGRDRVLRGGGGVGPARLFHE